MSVGICTAVSLKDTKRLKAGSWLKTGFTRFFGYSVSVSFCGEKNTNFSKHTNTHTHTHRQTYTLGRTLPLSFLLSLSGSLAFHFLFFPSSLRSALHAFYPFLSSLSDSCCHCRFYPTHPFTPSISQVLFFICIPCPFPLPFCIFLLVIFGQCLLAL